MSEPDPHDPPSRRSDQYMDWVIVLTVCLAFLGNNFAPLLLSMTESRERFVNMAFGGVMALMGALVQKKTGVQPARATKTVNGPDNSTTTVAPPAETPP